VFRISSVMKLDDLLEKDNDQLFQMKFRNKLALRLFKNKE